MPKITPFAIHIYTAPLQPATRYRVDVGDVKPFWCRVSPFKRGQCFECGRVRQARNLSVQVFYDNIKVFCRKGGCAGTKCRRTKGA
jgi:hypothetical protein